MYKYEIELEKWLFIESPSNLPQQTNDTDCGVYLCNFANLICNRVDMKKIKECWIDREQIKRRLCFKTLTPL